MEGEKRLIGWFGSREKEKQATDGAMSVLNIEF
jgi:hypothetical protein